MEPLFGLLAVIELKDNQTSGGPIPFEGFRLATARDIFPSIEFDGWRSQLLVIFIADRIGHVDVDDNIGSHELSPPEGIILFLIKHPLRTACYSVPSYLNETFTLAR